MNTSYIKHIACLWMAVAFTGHAQDRPKSHATEQFAVSGALKDSLIVRLADMNKMPSQSLGNLTITNHLGQVKKEYRNLKGIPLKTVLEKLTITSPSPKELSEYYFVCKAIDGYANVYSWNELFNTETGNQVFLVTAYQGYTLDTMPERIMLMATGDFRTGRRNLKNLSRIEVKRAE